MVILKNNRYYTIRKPLACICKNTNALCHKLKETLYPNITHAPLMRYSCVWLRIFSLK
ncbi:flavoprotein oxidoreductase [Helicobacter pylori]|uniref:flavoprotein oxidoreductase n=1 Tax=Helicobacter pylori TaxID=210 RepID=UPI0009AC4A42|nr:flavoprotein oxidoreductase [Helicobacter pylori]QDY56031.1 flavoprotein oxidoreductase [Helicobacter pylori B128]AVG74286.1 flavoprotein oxidoreductase [Helicobacter pylori]AVG80330.1 flavoprotein oxidoreductase [Helicobacter pylori]AVG81813.1 flavoprotein oxidoreductase [Helicobacter pylori]AVG83180.1 flavoprotein oxidoreductase [Helicobacter pylori]